jgi:hypothetical protein
MSAAALLARLQLGGVELKLDGGRLLCRSKRPGAVPQYFRHQIARCRPGLLALVTAEQGLPPGTRLFFERDVLPDGGGGRGNGSVLCWPEEATRWTWETATAWLSTADRPLPPCEPALHPRCPRRCPQCNQKAITVSWQACANDERRLRLQCKECSACCGWLRRDPRNADLIWRTT